MAKKLIFLIFTALFLISINLKGANNSLDGKPSLDSLMVRSSRVSNTVEEIVYLDSMLVMAQSMDSVHWQCRAMLYMARNYYNRGIKDSLNYWVDQLKPLALKHEKFSMFYDAFSLICMFDLSSYDYDRALENTNRLYMMAKEANDPDGMIASFETSGYIYLETFRYVEAIKSFREGLELQKQQKNPRYSYQFQFLTYIIESYLKLKDYNGVKNAIAEAYEAIESCKENAEPLPEERCLLLLCAYNIEMYVAQKMPEKAEGYIIEAKKYESDEDFWAYCYFHIVLSRYYQLLGNYAEALKHADLIASQTDGHMPAMRAKAELLLEAGKGLESARLYRETLNLIDSTYNESLSNQINQLRGIHEVDKLELKNQQMQLESSRFKLIAFIVLTSVLTFILIFITVNYIRMKRMKNKLEKSEKQLSLEKEQLIESEKQLSIAKERAEVSNRIKDEFLANLNHEVRTPLNNVVLFSNLLTDLHKKGEGQEYAKIVKDNSDKLLKLVNDTVAVSMLQTGTLPFDYKDVDVCLLCKSLLGEYEVKVSPDVKLEFEYFKDSYMLYTDANRLKQVLDNFILNSLKFTEKGYIKLSINLEENTGMVIFAVEDTGIGVPEDKQDKIFESFEQSDSFTQGLGLGLTICKLIAERIGGTISLDTNYKNGARFVFTHPIK